MDNKTLVINYQMAVNEVLKTGSGEAFKEFLANDIEWHLPISMKQHGGNVFTGIEGVEKMLTKNVRMFYQPETIDVEFRSMISENDLVHMHFGMTAKTPSGKNYHNDYQILFEVKNHKISKVWEYFDAHILIGLIAE